MSVYGAILSMPEVGKWHRCAAVFGGSGVIGQAFYHILAERGCQTNRAGSRGGLDSDAQVG